MVILPPVVESAIAPPFPEVELAYNHAPVVAIAPVPPVTDRVIFPPVPAPDESEYRLLVVMLPPNVEREMAPPFPEDEEEFRFPAVVSSEPVAPVTERVMFPPVPVPDEEEWSEPVVMPPGAVKEIPPGKTNTGNPP